MLLSASGVGRKPLLSLCGVPPLIRILSLRGLKCGKPQLHPPREPGSRRSQHWLPECQSS